LLLGIASCMVTSGSFTLPRQSLERSVPREVGWGFALDTERFRDYPPFRNDPEVIMPRSLTAARRRR
jgi:hypothetical protein